MTEPPEPEAPRRAPRRLRRRLAAVALGLGGVLVLLEGGLRVHHGLSGTYELDDEARKARTASIWMRSDDPELVYVHRPNYRSETYEHASTEASGLLHPVDVPRKKPAGVRRIAVIGDSIGTGLLYPHEQRFPALLQALLRENGAPVEVLNFCVNGYGTLQEARLLETRVGAFDPDAVVLQFCLNDTVVSYTPMAWFVDPDPPLSYLWHEVRRGVAPPGLPYAPKESTEGVSFWARQYDPESESWGRVRAGFDRIQAWARERSVPVLVAVVPLVIPSDPAGRFTAGFRQQILDEARARGFDAVDLQPAFALYAAEAIRETEGDPYHVNALGHEIIARALALHMTR